ncbi:DUF3817 domain-containing protein [Georgenia sp. TF02-10]|uniref:DUF3817 domain-containing protein n=1 Tax=Georgenia sp. TF02-10 TaxID=2917725 RepID=UPI001FA6B498|nr:DUF3817 domain-containing protein [Georgenia sp. TF02-10]UNX54283.1 DUF3817 domain-containing protein [Georgenia sp. TF02-10]
MSASSPTAVEQTERKARGAFSFYRVMAFVTGTMLLVLCLEMVLKYGFNDGQPVLGTWVAILHGWIYVVYAAAVLNLWSTMRWGFGRIVALIAGGVVPVLSFVMERRAQGWFTAELPALLARVAARAR